MNNLTYLEPITHIRKYKEVYKLGNIAKQIDMNPDQFRQVVSQRQYAQELPEKYRVKFIEMVRELTSIRQEVPNVEVMSQALTIEFRNHPKR